MGDIISRNLAITWSTPVKQLISDYIQSCRIFGHIALDKLHRLAQTFSETVIERGGAVFDAILAKSVVISITAVKMCGFTFRQFMECSKYVLESIAQQAVNRLPVGVRQALFAQLK